MTISINPGTEDVDDATPEHAAANMAQLIADLAGNGVEGLVEANATGDPDGGRYPFKVLFADGRTVEVDMPGLPLDQVRYLGEPEQDIWAFPRLYVDGSSWLWKYALNMFGPPETDA